MFVASHNNLLIWRYEMNNETYTLTLVQNYSAAHGVDFARLSQRDQEIWMDRLLGASTEDEEYLELIGGIGANDDIDV